MGGLCYADWLCHLTWRLEHNCTINLGTRGCHIGSEQRVWGGISGALAEEHFLVYCLSELSHLQTISITVMYCNFGFYFLLYFNVRPAILLYKTVRK
jgi:hypothetical protein